ncbi:MAG: S8 family serine peptidase [Oscillospiraceae bacterium]|jgi:hypothetical protein|nr:S8 family serine peptidase [Oscillospiraceae bacterium]
MKTKKIISILLTITMLVGIIAAMPTVSANTVATFVHDGYTIEYNIDGNWGHGQNIRMTITNTGTETIENWMLAFDDFYGEIENPWNAGIEQTDCGVEYLRNRNHNANISPNETVSFGYMLENPTGIPSVIVMAQERVEKTTGFTAELNVVNSWGGAFNGEIVLTNTTDHPIEWWELTFDSNFTITEIVSSWAATSTDNGGGNYTFKGTYTGIVAPYSSVSLGFQATMDGTPWITADKLTEVVVCQFVLESPATRGFEPKRFSNATIDDDFCDSSVLVVIDRKIGELNKIHEPEIFGDFPIVEINDLTWSQSGNTDRDVTYFRQILEIVLPTDCKENVLEVIAELEKVDGVRSAGPAYYLSFSSASNEADNSHETDQRWGLENINASKAWEFTSGSSEVLVGILDSGIAVHSDLENVNRELGRNFVNDEASTEDINGHGTHVAGVVNSVSPGVTLVPLQVLSVTSKTPVFEWRGTTTPTIRAITYAKEENIPILNLSAGDGTRRVCGALEQAICAYPGLFITSAGNSRVDNDFYGTQYNLPNTPARYNLPNMISVGAIDKNNERCSFSNFGESVHVFAPGVSIYTTCTGKNGDHSHWHCSGNSHCTVDGTSLAAPYVTGVAALLLSVYPDATTEELKSVILDGANQIDIKIPGRVKDSKGEYYYSDDLKDLKVTAVKQLNALGAFAAMNRLRIKNLYIRAVNVEENWIEIYNPTDERLSASGLYLSNSFDNLIMWALPSFIIQPGEIFLIGGRDNVDSHIPKRGYANFNMSHGVTLYLVDLSWGVVSLLSHYEVAESSGGEP